MDAFPSSFGIFSSIQGNEKSWAAMVLWVGGPRFKSGV